MTHELVEVIEVLGGFRNNNKAAISESPQNPPDKVKLSFRSRIFGREICCYWKTELEILICYYWWNRKFS